jgi:nucleoside-diphosphate-sugar epimerase
MKVLVTGGGGFIGSHLVEDQLRKGRNVTALDLDLSFLKEMAEDAKLRKIVGDIRNRDLVAESLVGVDLVFHLAGAHLSLTTSEHDYWEINVKATESLVELCRTAGVKRFIHCSTVGVYGDVKNAPADEESACAPDLVYDKSKLAGEQVIAKFYRETSYPISIIRPAWVYGPRCPRTAKLFRSIARQRFPMVGAGFNLRHCIYVSDLIDGFELCASRDEAVGQTFILGDDTAVTVAQLVNDIATVMNVPSPRIKVPLRIAVPICALTELVFQAGGKEPPLSKRSLKFFTNSTSFDIGKAKTLLEFVPKVTLKDGLERTYDYLVRHGQLEAPRSRLEAQSHPN